ncbi:biopolymer transporter ExbD [Marinimicrobium sp. C6131]|uniref:ExbD/TolR family protein n=1 Tax=Marinimicrobium sp. C6131 TaxID=3022676 RepID=UPI00223CE908|nr:biopolymer transporter ExbD [Marinimicrobium sp. C6131]UZJ46098.1 biopolymer transporter ExbD [Marinimicrobium sp. C6131]
MRRKKSRSGDDSNDIDLTPMLDVVFIMLIFFIVTASFVKEIGLDTNVPEENDQPPPEDADPNIVVDIRQDNQIWMENRRVDTRAIRSNIERMRAELPDATVIIRAHERSDAEVYVAVADAARAANAPGVVLVPMPEEMRAR